MRGKGPVPLRSYYMKLRRKKESGSRAHPRQWPGAEAWLTVVDEAVRAAHAAHCVALALKGRPHLEDTMRFLMRRAEMLLRFVESLVTESRCGDRFREMSTEELLHGMKHIETSLTAKVRHLMNRAGQREQMAKLLENEALIGQISQTRIQLALMEPDKANGDDEVE
jgi:hypothetical protein